MAAIDLKSWLSREEVISNVTRVAAGLVFTHLISACTPTDPKEATGDAKASLQACHLQKPEVDVSKVLEASYVIAKPGPDGQNGRVEIKLQATKSVDGEYVEFTPAPGENLPNEFDDRDTILVIEDNTIEGVDCTDVINLANNEGGFFDWMKGIDEDGVYDQLRLQGNDDPRCEALCEVENGESGTAEGESDTTDTSTTEEGTTTEDTTDTTDTSDTTTETGGGDCVINYTGPERAVGDEIPGVDPETHTLLKFGEAQACDNNGCTDIPMEDVNLTVLASDYPPVMGNILEIGEVSVAEIEVITYDNFIEEQVNLYLAEDPDNKPYLDMSVEIESDFCLTNEPQDPPSNIIKVRVHPGPVAFDPLETEPEKDIKF